MATNTEKVSDDHALTDPTPNHLAPRSKRSRKLAESRNTNLLEKVVFYPLEKVVVFIDRSAHYMSNSKADDYSDEVMHYARPSIVFGIWTIVIVFGFFGTWAALAPLDSAAVAKGSVVLNSSRKTIQHLEGGIIEKIFVKDGDAVKAGQPLIQLSETEAKSRQATLQTQLYAAEALEDRLEAERDNKNEVTFRQDLLANSSKPDVISAMDIQRREFAARKQGIEGKIEVLNQRKAEANDQIKGLAAQQVAAEGQIKLFKEEIGTVKTLLASGNANKPRLLSLEEREAELEGTRGQAISEIAKAQQDIGETDIEILNARNDMLNDVMKELRDTHVQVADLRDKLSAAADISNRMVITAPQAGIVNGLMYHTVGGVIGPGAPLMDIVPQDDKLVIDAQVSPMDIESVHVGERAKIRLTAYRQRTINLVEGTVVTVSADKMTDNKAYGPAQSYYIARIDVDPDSLKQSKQIKLYPGMPADVLIVTGQRTFLHYMLGSILDTMDHSFREKDF